MIYHVSGRSIGRPNDQVSVLRSSRRIRPAAKYNMPVPGAEQENNGLAIEIDRDEGAESFRCVGERCSGDRFECRPRLAVDRPGANPLHCGAGEFLESATRIAQRLDPLDRHPIASADDPLADAERCQLCPVLLLVQMWRLVMGFLVLAVAGQECRSSADVMSDMLALVVVSIAAALGRDWLDAISHLSRAGEMDRVWVKGGVAERPCPHFLIGWGQALIPALPRGVGEDGLEQPRLAEVENRLADDMNREPGLSEFGEGIEHKWRHKT